MGRVAFASSLSIAFVVAGLFSPPVAARDGLTLSPSTEWKFDRFDDRCRASRTFGQGENQTALWLEQGGEQANYNLTMIGRPLRHPYGGGVHVQFGEEPEFIRSYISAKSGKGRPVLIMYGVKVVQPDLERGENDEAPQFDIGADRLASINTLRFRTSIVEPLELQIGGLDQPAAFLNSCGAKIERDLSAALRAIGGEASPPEPIRQSRWIFKGDFPTYLFAAQMGGSVRVRLTVSKTGKTSSCFVMDTNKPQLFNDTVCLALMKRAKFKPARNMKGEPIASYFDYAVTLSFS